MYIFQTYIYTYILNLYILKVYILHVCVYVYTLYIFIYINGFNYLQFFLYLRFLLLLQVSLLFLIIPGIPFINFTFKLLLVTPFCIVTSSNFICFHFNQSPFDQLCLLSFFTRFYLYLPRELLRRVLFLFDGYKFHHQVHLKDLFYFCEVDYLTFSYNKKTLLTYL